MSLDISQYIQVRIEPAATCEKPCPGVGGGWTFLKFGVTIAGI